MSSCSEGLNAFVVNAALLLDTECKLEGSSCHMSVIFFSNSLRCCRYTLQCSPFFFFVDLLRASLKFWNPVWLLLQLKRTAVWVAFFLPVTVKRSFLFVCLFSNDFYENHTLLISYLDKNQEALNPKRIQIRIKK